MDAITHHLYGCIDFLISDCFPQLKGVKIIVKKSDSDNYFMAIRTLPFRYTLYYTDSSYQELDPYQYLGCISHELAHIQQYRSKSFIYKLIDPLLWFLSASYRTSQEREADKIALNNGSGYYLFEFMKYHDKHYEKYNKQDGLTKKEIRSYLYKTNGRNI